MVLVAVSAKSPSANLRALRQAFDAAHRNTRSSNDMHRGSLTALVTPFDKGGAFDEKPLRFVEWQIQEGTKDWCPVGTTGELLSAVMAAR